MERVARQVSRPEDPRHGLFRRIEPSGRDVGPMSMRDYGKTSCFPLFPACRAMPCRAGLADGDEADDAELCLHKAGKGREGVVLAEDRGETAAGGGERDREVGGKPLAAGNAVHDPFERKAVVEGEDLAETLDELLVAHGGGIADSDAMVGKPAFHAAFSGADEFFAAGQGGAEECAVEGGVEIGQAGAEAQAGLQGAARGGGPLAFEVGGGGFPAEGGGVGTFFADADLAADFVEDPHADFAEREGGEDGRSDGEEDGEESVGAGADEVAAHAMDAAEGGGGVGEDGFHGGDDM